jgi:hypothetical protein
LCQIILVQPENRTQFSQLGLCLRRHLWWQLEGKSITRNPSYHQLSDVSRPTELRDVPGLPFSMGKMNMVSGRLRVSTFWDNPMRGPKEILLNSTWEYLLYIYKYIYIIVYIYTNIYIYIYI